MAKRRRKSHKRRSKRHVKMTVAAPRKRRRSRRRKVTAVAMPRKRNRRSRKSHRRAVRRSSGVTLRRVGGFRAPKQRYRIAGTVLSNPLGGLVRLPTMNELMWVGGAALVVPAISKLMKSPANPMPAIMKDGWGGIATELVLASVASVMVRKYVNATAGDAIFILGLANGVTQVVRKVAPVSVQEMIGITPMQVAVAASAPTSVGTQYYAPSRLGHMDPQAAGGFGDSNDSFPSMT